MSFTIWWSLFAFLPLVHFTLVVWVFSHLRNFFLNYWLIVGLFYYWFSGPPPAILHPVRLHVTGVELRATHAFQSERTERSTESIDCFDVWLFDLWSRIALFESWKNTVIFWHVWSSGNSSVNQNFVNVERFSFLQEKEFMSAPSSAGSAFSPITADSMIINKQMSTPQGLYSFSLSRSLFLTFSLLLGYLYLLSIYFQPPKPADACRVCHCRTDWRPSLAL